MIRNILIAILLASSVSNAPAQEDFLWTTGTAYAMPAGRWDIGICQPLRYGFSDNVELSAHPALFFVMPNLTVKIHWTQAAGFVVSSQHGFAYPTFLLRLVAREGIGGIISPEFKIPHMVSLGSGVVATRPLGTYAFLTCNGGISFGIGPAPDIRTTIDLPVLFPRMSVFYNHYLVRLGTDVTWKLTRRWEWLEDLDVFIMPGWDEKLALENKGLIIWNKSDRFRVLAGYKLVYGQYPYGNAWDFISPLIDMQWGW